MVPSTSLCTFLSSWSCFNLPQGTVDLLVGVWFAYLLNSWPVNLTKMHGKSSNSLDKSEKDQNWLDWYYHNCILRQQRWWQVLRPSQTLDITLYNCSQVWLFPKRLQELGFLPMKLTPAQGILQGENSPISILNGRGAIYCMRPGWWLTLIRDQFQP